jgi:hypothetical protein
MRLNKLSRRTMAAKPTKSDAEREGFALPMAILVIAFMTVTIAAAYAATSSEMSTNSAQRSESRAYMIAQAGLENFMARRNEPGFCPTIPRAGQTAAPCGVPPQVTTESLTIKLPGGYAEIVARRVRVGTLTRPAIYLMRSRGVDTSSKGITGSSLGAYAERTVAQLVYWNVNQVQVISGWTSANGLDKTGSSGTISGVDNNTGITPGCPPQHNTVAGIAVPTGDYSANGNFQPTGSPPIQYLGDQAATNASIKIDWNGIVNGDRIQPDYTFNSGAEATAAWPDMSNPNSYPVIRVNGDLTLDATSLGGHGTLIVMGNLTINGNNLWKGIIMVGGTMVSNGNNTMLGATMSGLNELLTPPQLIDAQALSSTTLDQHPANALAKGTKTFQYDSCEVNKAAAGLATYSVYPNAWMDNFVTY